MWDVQKESQFFARIKKNRVDPTNSSTGNPGMCSGAQHTS